MPGFNLTSLWTPGIQVEMGELRQETEEVSTVTCWLFSRDGQQPRPEAGIRRLMLVSNWQEERDEATQNEGGHLQAAEALPATGVGFVAVPHSAHLREDMYCGNIKKCPGREKHGHSSGIHLWKGFFTALWIKRGGGREGRKIKTSTIQGEEEVLI